jgi:hypothetical protein
MATRFLTYRFYSFLTNPNESGDVLKYKTYMPLIYDSIYFLPSAMSYSDAFNILISEGKTPEEVEIILKNQNGYFTPSGNHESIFI